MDTPINVFSEWAQNGKDEGMEKHHRDSVMNMLDFACNGLSEYSFIDAGCGNGWVIRHTSNDDKCSRAIGVDGSSNMITKAKRLDNKNQYCLFPGHLKSLFSFSRPLQIDNFCLLVNKNLNFQSPDVQNSIFSVPR